MAVLSGVVVVVIVVVVVLVGVMVFSPVGSLVTCAHFPLVSLRSSGIMVGLWYGFLAAPPPKLGKVLSSFSARLFSIFIVSVGLACGS